MANFNSFISDYVTRQKIGGITLNFFIVEQIATLPPDTYNAQYRGQRKKRSNTGSASRLKLSCTADDMKPLAEACKFQGSEGGGVNKWRNHESAWSFAPSWMPRSHLYGISEDEFTYVLSTFPSVSEPEILATRSAYQELAARTTSTA